MGVLSLTCPHCDTEHVWFKSVSEHINPQLPELRTVFFVCGSCFGGVCAMVLTKQGYSSPHAIEGNLESIKGYDIVKTYPTPTVIEAPDHLPENISRLYLQAADNLRRKNWDASGAMCRKALDIATLKIDPTLKGKLQGRIDRLAEDHLITPAMKDWAHAIRLDGNEATHEDEFDEVTSKDLLSFTELFLMYAFTLPGMLAERKQRARN